MTRSRPSRSSFFLFFALAASVGACAGQGDIDRTQPDKIDKSIFFDAAGQPKTWYYQETIAGFPPTVSWAFEGMQLGLQKVRFQIQQDYLIGYRAYDYVAGSQNDFTAGGNNTDTPVVMYKIKSHFDVKRDYNPATGEQTNVIVENTMDRPWDQRQFMRVDWSINLAQKDNPFAPIPDPTQPMFDLLFGSRQPLAWYVSETDTHNPEFADRAVINGNVIDFVGREVFTPDLSACLNFWDAVYDENGPWGCGPAEIKMRHSFRLVTPSTYEPLEYPDNFQLTDNMGQPIQLLANGAPCTETQIAQTGGTLSGADCSSATVPGFSKFGFFRTIRQTYNRNYGTTELGRKYYANRWNIWQDTIQRNDDGTPKLDGSGQTMPIKYGARKTRQITFYTNIEFPDDPALFAQAQNVTNDWNKAMKMTVAGLLATEVSTVSSLGTVSTMAAAVPDIVVLKQNSCNLTDFVLRLKKYGDLADMVKDATGQSPDELDKAHLANACSIVEVATQNLKDDDAKKFSWQRVGDLRYSFFHWVDRPQPGGPLGYGPSSADPETGEIITATLFNYGANLDTYAQFAADTVELLNNQISVDDILSGKTIADVFKETAAARQLRQATQLTPEAKTMATTLVRRGAPAGSTGPQLIPIPAGASSSKLEALRGTDLERELMTPEIVAAMLPELSPQSTALTQDQINRASPATWLSDSARAARQNRFQRLAMNGCVYMGEFADDGIIGLALKLKNRQLSGDALFKELRTLIFRGLADHEMGHTMGLRHNFSGSTDALNYGDDFWRIRATTPQTEWENNSLSEYQYSTVMDYGSRFNSDVNGLGKYDMAAIRFGYGQLVDVMPSAATSAGVDLANRVFLSDYSKLPAAVGGVDNLKDGGVARYDRSVVNTLSTYYQNPSAALDFTVVNMERPYKFCGDEYIGNLDCKPWDFGANQQEIINDTIDRYRNYYFFNAYKRGRITWTLDGYLSRLLDRYYSRYTEAFQFYYFFGSYLSSLASDPSTPYDVDLGDDLLKASVDSLNAIGEVLQTPEPGTHCATPVSPDVMVLPSSSGPNACVSGAPFMNIQVPDGKPYFIDFSSDYYYRITRAGSLYEKLAGLISLTSTQARFYRVDTFADSNNYSINYYRLFKDEMLNLLSGVIRNDPVSYGGYATNAGNYQAVPVVDLTTWGQVNPTMPPYMMPGAKRVDTPVNKTIRYYALLLSLANLNSTWDSTLDLANYAAVTVKGSNDDQTFSPSTVVHEYSHPQTGVIYRAPQFDGRVGIGVKLVDELTMLTGTKGVRGTIPARYGYNGAASLPDWQTAKADLDAAQASGDQTAYNNALNVFQALDYLVSYRVDLLDDLRLFKRAFGY